MGNANQVNMLSCQLITIFAFKSPRCDEKESVHVLSLAANLSKTLQVNNLIDFQFFFSFVVFFACRHCGRRRRSHRLFQNENDYIVLLSYLYSESGIFAFWWIYATDYKKNI